MNDDAGVSADGSGFRAVTVALNCDDPAEVDAVFAAWVDAGATPVKRPEEVFWGGMEMSGQALYAAAILGAAAGVRGAVTWGAPVLTVGHFARRCADISLFYLF